VFSSQRPVIVPDVRLLPRYRANPTNYRTFSFAAAPMLAGREAIGVITVTDKRGNGAFTRQDEFVLRTLSAAAAVALVAARAGDEVTRLAYAATVDGMTGLLNRPGFEARLHQEIERARREAGEVAVLMADVDNFKTINDTRGHQEGDSVLRLVASALRSSVRVFDVCARYGGDEFAVVMPNSDRESAILCAERIRRRLADRNADDDLPALTMSIGVAIIAPGESASDVILRADQCLYLAKADGKNLVRAQPPRLFEPTVDHRDLHASEARVIDIRQARDENAASGETASRGTGPLRYVLVVDPAPERAGVCLEAVARFRVGCLIARNGSQASGIIERFGPPLLLVVDLALPSSDGFELIESLRHTHGAGSEVIAWCGSREMREYAAARLTGHEVHVLASTAAASTIRAAIEHSLERKVAAAPEPAARWPAEELQRVMSELTYRTKQIVNTPGIAVYMHGPGDRSCRAAFSWNSDQLMPYSPCHLPRAFEEVAMSGRVVITRDLATASKAAESDAVRGLAGFPVVSNGEILGALCVFDVLPLAIADDQMSALETLARTGVADLTDPGVEASLQPPATSVAALVEDRPIAAIAAGPLDWPPALLERVGGEFAVARELARARREGTELSVILFEFAPLTAETDVDESVMRASETLLKAIRQSDLPIRWSGREFLVVLPGLTGSAARSVAERVRAALQAGTRHRMAVAGGVAELADEEVFGEVVSRAREKVSLARSRGHNRVL
jgi:diguanylate cyclase (GGDEF)-like protein